jgi:hypothetical protein
MRLGVEISAKRISDPETLWKMVSEQVRETAILTTNIKRKYIGNVQRTTDPEPGLLNGYIYGSLKF